MAEKALKRLERKGRDALRAVLRLGIRKPAVPKTIDSAWVKKVLVIRQENRLGNLVMLTPMISAVRLAFPKADVHVLTSDVFPEVFDALPGIARVIAAPKKAFIGNPIRFLSFFRALRREQYDLAFDCSHMHEFSLSSGAAARMVSAQATVGYKRGDADLYLQHLVEPMPAGTHEMDIHMALLRAVTPPDSLARLPARGTLRPSWQITPEEATRASARWAAWGIAEGTATGVFLGGRGTKRWPPEKFAELARREIAREKTVVFFGGPGEKGALETLRSLAGARVAEPLPLREFAATMRGCAIVVTSDSGPMHVAVAVGVPTIQIFSASEPERYGYAHLPEHRVVGRQGEEVSVDTVDAALGARR